MNIGEIASVAEIIGGAAVIVSLIYLAVQVRQNALQTKLSSALSLNHLINEAFDPIYNNDRTMDIWTDGLRDASSLNEQDQAIFSLFMARLINVLLTALMHDEHNFLEAKAAKIYTGSMNAILKSAGGQYWMKEMGGEAFLNDTAKEVLANSDEQHNVLTHGSSRS